MKKCSKCKLEKNLEDYPNDNTKKDGKHSSCKSCKKNTNGKYYQQNIEKKKEYDKKNKEKIKEYYQNNKEKFKAQQKEYKKNNKEKIKVYHKNKLKTDINYRLSIILRKRLNRAIKNNQKSGSAVSDLGCSIEKFKLWLEMHWLEGMSWDNYGYYGWHIDHKIPISNFDLINRDELLKACHFSNLQPLWMKDNLSKGEKYSNE